MPLSNDDINSLVGILAVTSPTEVAGLKILRDHFNFFFSRGSVEHCWQLIPDAYKTTILERYVDVSPRYTTTEHPSSRTDPLAPISMPSISLMASKSSDLTGTILSASSHNLSSKRYANDKAPESNNSSITVIPYSRNDLSDQKRKMIIPNSKASAVDYFAKRNPDSSSARIQRLVRAVQGFQEAQKLSTFSYSTLWSSTPDIFGGSDSKLARIDRLQQGREKLKTTTAKHECASRLALMLLNHDVDHLSSMKPLPSLSPGKVKKRSSCAYEELANKSNVSSQKLRSDCNKSTGYLELLVQAGPGYLLEIGRNVASLWEEKFRHDEIKVIVQFLKEELPEFNQRATSLNETAADAIISGLCAYGWTIAELCVSQSLLLRKIRKYVDLPRWGNGGSGEAAADLDIVSNENRNAGIKSVRDTKRVPTSSQARDTQWKLRNYQGSRNLPSSSSTVYDTVQSVTTHHDKEPALAEQRYPTHWNEGSVYDAQGASAGANINEGFIGASLTGSRSPNITSQTDVYLQAAVNQCLESSDTTPDELMPLGRTSETSLSIAQSLYPQNIESQDEDATRPSTVNLMNRAPPSKKRKTHTEPDSTIPTQNGISHAGQIQAKNTFTSMLAGGPDARINHLYEHTLVLDSEEGLSGQVPNPLSWDRDLPDVAFAQAVYSHQFSGTTTGVEHNTSHGYTSGFSPSVNGLDAVGAIGNSAGIGRSTPACGEEIWVGGNHVYLNWECDLEQRPLYWDQNFYSY